MRLVFSPSSRRLQARSQTRPSRQLRGVASSLMIDGAIQFWGGRRHEDQPEPRFVEGSKVAAIGWHWSSRIVPYAICSIQTLPRAVAACRGIYCHPPVPISSSPLTSRGAAGWQWLGPSTWHPITWCFETSLMVLSGGQTRLLRCKLPVRRIKEPSENFPPISVVFTGCVSLHVQLLVPFVSWHVKALDR